MLTEFLVIFHIDPASHPPKRHTHTPCIHSQLSKVTLNSLSSKQTEFEGVSRGSMDEQGKQEQHRGAAGAGLALLISICVNINAKRHDLSQPDDKMCAISRIKAHFLGLLLHTHHSCGSRSRSCSRSCPPLHAHVVLLRWLYGSSVVHKTQRVTIVWAIQEL